MAERAEYSPKECPATILQSSFIFLPLWFSITRINAILTANKAGWVFSVLFKSSASSPKIIDERFWEKIKKQMEKDLKIDAPGGGISFTISLSSIGGKHTLEFLLEDQNYQKEAETTLKNTNHELIVVIAVQGYTDLIMDAERGAGAYGGTVIHAKGTGMELAEKFMGVSLAVEKEMVFIVTKTEQKNNIMKAIIKDAGINSKAKSITFSLPVTDTAGLRLVED